MKTLIRFLLSISIFLLLMPNAKATHLMGGDLTYRHLHDSTYELTFLVYRDCNSGQAAIDAAITYWVYYKKTKNVFLNNKTVALYKNQRDKVLPEAPNCVTPSGVCIESGKYIDTVVLGSDPDGYIVNWFRLERNHDIANLKRCSSSTNNSSCNTGGCNNRNPFGMVWTTEIPAYKFENSSPQFLTVPVPYFCTGITNSFNHVVFDPDGDSLVFKIVTPLSPDQCSPALPTPSSTSAAPAYSSVYQTVTYQSGYSATKPFGSSSSAISINSTTGEMKANPSSAGSYVIAVKIEEYRVDPVTRKATYLGSVRRDLQFIAGNCPNVSNSPPYFSKAGSATIEVNPYDTIEFDIEVADNSDTVYMKANGSIFGVLGSSIQPPFASFKETKGFKSAKQTFFWVPTCDHITYTSPHVFTINLSDEGCNSVQRTYSIYVRGRDIYTPPDIKCLQVLSDKVISVSWDTLKNVQYFNGLYVYRVNPDGSRQKIKSYTDSTVLGFNDSTVSNASSSLYRYYLKIENSCGLEGYPSDSLSTIVLTHTEINDKTLRFDWNSYGKGPYRYILQKKTGGNFTDVDSTTKNFLDYTSCVLNTDFRIKTVDTTNQQNCVFYSSITTSTTIDKSPPVGAANFKVASVVDYKSINIVFEKSSSSEVTQYAILRSRNGSSWSNIATVSASSSIINHTDNSSLSTNNNHYCYRIIAADSCGNAGDTSKIHCPVNLKVYSGQRESKLKWNKYRGFVIDSQYVDRFDSIAQVWKPVASLGSNDSAYIDNKNTLCGFDYSYRIRTTEKAFSTPYVSLSDSVFVKPKDTIASAAVDILGASIIDDTTATVIFKSSASTDVKDYLVLALEYDGASLKNTYSNNFVLQNQDTFTVQVKTPLTDKRKYCFGVIAIDSCGQNFSPNAELHCPSFLTGTQQNLANTINWTKYDGFLVDSFIVETKENGVWTKKSAFGRTRRTAVYSNLGCNIPIDYRVKVKERTTGQIIYSNDITLTPFDSIKPKAPVVNFSTVDNDTTVRLEWQQSTANDVVKYEIFYGLNGSTLTLLDSVLKGTSSTETYAHRPVNAKNDTFTYRVIAIDSCSALNRSVNNKQQDVIQLDGEGANLENKISWSAYRGFDVKEYQIEKFDKTLSTWTQITSTNNSTLNYVHDNLNCVDTTTYRIKAIDNNSSFFAYSDTIRLKPFDTISPVPPVISYVSVSAKNRIKIAWQKSISDDANKYVLYRKSPRTKYAVIDTFNNVFEYTDIANTDSLWSYAMIAIDSCIGNTSFYKSDAESNMVVSSAQSGCQDSLKLIWNAYLEFENGLNNYEIFRRVDGKPEVKIATVANNKTTYTDKVSQHHNYAYRIRAIENGGVNESYSQPFEANVFQTPIPKILSSSVVLTDRSNGEIKIDWEKQEGKQQVSFSRLYYKEINSGSFTLLQNNIALTDSSFTHTGLNTKTTNHQYFMVNIDSCGTISDTLSIHKTMDMQFGYGQLEHNLSWTSYEGFNVEQYILQQLISGSYVDIDTVPGASSAFNRFPAPCNTPIIYRIAAEDIDGNVAYSDTTVGTAIDLTSPNAATLLNVSVIDNNHIQIDFNGGDSLDTYGYAIEKSRNGAPYITDGIVVFTSPKQSVTYKDSVKLDSIHYAYRVVALDSCLNATNSAVFKPIGLTGKPGNFENYLAWHPYVGYPVDSYIVEMQSGTNWLYVGSTPTTDTNFIHKGVGCNTPVTYRIRAERSTGSYVNYSNWIELTPFDTISPNKPDFFSASVLNDKQLELSWNYDANSDVKYFAVYRQNNTGGFDALDTVIRTNKYVDSVFNATDSIYSYRIFAIDSCNSNHISPISDTVTNFIYNYKLDTCDPTTYLNWSEPRGLLSNIDMYFINRSTDGRPFRVIDTVFAPLLTFADSNVTSGSTYRYRITAYNSTINQRSETDTQAFVQRVRPKSKAPNVLYTSVTKSDNLNGEVELAWNKISKQEDVYVNGYRVYGADTLKSRYDFIAELNSRNDTMYKHSTATSKTYNYYRVTAISTCGLSGDSSLLNAPIQLDVEGLNLSSKLNWSEYYGFNIDRYNVYRNVSGSGFALAGTVPSNIFTFRDTTVGCGESVDFRIEAVSDFGFLAQSDIENVIGFDTTLPKPTTIQYVSVLNDKEIELVWNPSISKDAKFYTISHKRFNDNVWDTLVSGITGLSHTESSLPIPLNNPWQFRVSVTDSCGNDQPIPSPEHHHIGLEAIKNGPTTDLKWMNYKGWPVTEFQIFRDNNLIQTLNISKARFDSLFSYSDTAIGCDSTIYNYHLVALNAAGVSSKSNSDTTWGIDQSTPASVYLKSASVLPYNDGVRLRWGKSGTSDIKTYNVLRKTINAENYELVKKVDRTTLSTIDTLNLNTSKYYCYKISVEDACANEGLLSNEGCVMVLTGGNLKRANSIKWNEYTKWPDSVDYYEIYRGTDSTNLEFLTKVDSRVKTYVDTALNDTFMTYCYKVKAVEKIGDNNDFVWSTLLCATQEPLIYIPNAFTPELSEGINDFFGPKGAFVPRVYNMSIYNRWGQKVYNTSQGQAWDGRFVNREFVPDGVYLYIIEMTTVNGETYVRKGNVKVFR